MPAVEIVDFHESKFWVPDPKGFTEKLEAIGLKEINGKKELCLNFGVDNTNDEEIPKDLVIRGIGKLKEDGKISDFFDIGKFIKSARALGLKPMLQEDGNLSFIPSIVGKVVTMKPENPKGREVTNDAGEKKVYYTWVLDSIQGITKAGAPAQGTATTQPPAPKADANAMLEPFYEWMVNNVKAPMTEAQISKKIIETKAGADYNKVRRQCLIQLSGEKDGRVVQDLTDEKNPKYSVA
jgi:hypothetical protein